MDKKFIFFTMLGMTLGIFIVIFISVNDYFEKEQCIEAAKAHVEIRGCK